MFLDSTNSIFPITVRFICPDVTNVTITVRYCFLHDKIRDRLTGYGPDVIYNIIPTYEIF